MQDVLADASQKQFVHGAETPSTHNDFVGPFIFDQLADLFAGVTVLDSCRTGELVRFERGLNVLDVIARSLGVLRRS